ncbi:MAG: hypothetical protein K9G76_11765 [Bacteroidales bacterium]|nr:hypothetical protein [Bacteroidales bacterium]MCF8405119.1 hypothetical protein [Bacteroidales bacterium]
MKKVFSTTLIILLMLASTGFGQDESSYMFVMVKNKKALKMAGTEADFQSLANTFDRISNAETDQWHPLYYAALCYINMSFVNKDNTIKDNYLDVAQGYVDRALEIYPDESEIITLQALLYQGRIQIDPATRGLEFTQKSNDALHKAMEYNPDNPRVYYLQGLNLLHSPAAYGGSQDLACEHFKTAMEKFILYTPEHVLAPTWGAERNQMLYSSNCSK